jgi:heat shock protein HslJ
MRRMRPSDRTRSTACLLAALAATVMACGPRGAGGDTGPDALRGRSFQSVHVQRDGRVVSLADGTRIDLSFEETGIRWEEGCNFIGGTVTIGNNSLDVLDYTVHSTDIRCPALQAQDDWVSAFFQSDPRWDLRDQTLTLTSEDTRIVFEAK